VQSGTAADPAAARLLLWGPSGTLALGWLPVPSPESAGSAGGMLQSAGSADRADAGACVEEQAGASAFGGWWLRLSSKAGDVSSIRVGAALACDAMPAAASPAEPGTPWSATGGRPASTPAVDGASCGTAGAALAREASQAAAPEAGPDAPRTAGGGAPARALPTGGAAAAGAEQLAPGVWTSESFRSIVHCSCISEAEERPPSTRVSLLASDDRAL